MPRTRPPYSPEFRRQMVDLVRAGRSPDGACARRVQGGLLCLDPSPAVGACRCRRSSVKASAHGARQFATDVSGAARPCRVASARRASWSQADCAAYAGGWIGWRKPSSWRSFSVIVVWERFNEAEGNVAQEAGAAATIYRLADGVDAKPRTALRESLAGYLEAVVTQEWPAMERGHASPAARRALDGVYAAILTFSPADGRGLALLSEILHQTDLLTQSRRARLVMASGIVPAVIWISLFGGAVLTVGFTLFFGTENLRAQTLMTGALTALIFSGLLVIISIDHPFAGPVKVEPEALSAVLGDFREGPPP